MTANSNTVMSVYQRQKLSLGEIVEKIVDVEEDTISLAENRYSHAQELLSMIRAAEIPDGTERFTITCAKSGAFIRYVTIDEFALLEKIHGSNRAIEILEMRCTTNIAAHWLYTDGKTLEKLAEYDPFGYFIYAIDKVLRATQDMFIGYERLDDSAQIAAINYRWHKTKHHAWKAIQNQPIDKIIKVNELMRRYLSVIDTSYARHVVKFHDNNIIEIAEFKLLNFINALQENIRAVLQWAWKNNRIRRDITIDDVAKLRNIFKGHSHFAQQRKPDNQSTLERVVAELAPFFNDDENVRGKYRAPVVSDEKLKEMQTGKVKAFTLTQKTFNLKVRK